MDQCHVFGKMSRYAIGAQSFFHGEFDPSALLQIVIFLLCVAFNLERINATEVFGMPMGVLSSALKGLCALLLCFCFFSRLPSREELIRVLGISILLVFEYLSSKSFTFLWCALAVLAVRGSTLQWIARSVFISYIGFFVVVCALCLVGVIEPVVGSRSGGVLDRSSFGFSGPNQFGTMLIVITMSWIVWRWPRITKLDLLVPALCVVLCLVVADSRTSVVILIFFSVSVAVYMSFDGKFSVASLAKAAIIVLLALLLLSVLLMAFYDDGNPFLFSLSKLTSGRLYYMNRYAELYPITPFGLDFSTAELIVKETFSTRLLLDNVYACLLLKHGYVLTVVFISLLVALLNAAKRVPNSMAVVFLLGMLSFIISGFFENGMIDITVNFFLFGLSVLVYPESRDGFFSSKTSLMSGLPFRLTGRECDL